MNDDVEDINRHLRSDSTEWEAEHERRIEGMDGKIDEACRKAGHTGFRVQFAAHPNDETGLPVDNLAEIAHHGSIRIVWPRNEYWGGPASQDYQSPVLTDPTWLELCVIANEALDVTKDRTHVFLEGIDLEDGEADDANIGQVQKCSLRMGS